MKVLQINTVFGVKSTGRTCAETAKALRKAGHECYTAYGVGNSDDNFTYKIVTEFEYYTHNILSRITGMQGYYSASATKRLINYIKDISPDIIHLRNLHANYLNFPILFDFLKEINIPVVLNLHDCWAFTGKCAYYTDNQCFKWKTECNNCPVVKQYPQSLFFDKTNRLFNDKKKWFSELKNLTVIGVSNWVSDQARMSFLSERKIYTVYNWINGEVFKPYNENAFENYGIDTSKFTILGVSASWTKGTKRYEDFVKLSSLIQDDMQLVLVGQKTEQDDFPSNIIHIPYVENTNELAKFYSSADVYVHLSTEDTFGKVIAEAMACGTPTVVYDATACPEVSGSYCGYVAEKGNIKDIYNGIRMIKGKGKNNFRETCISRAKELFDYETNTNQLITIYETLVKAAR